MLVLFILIQFMELVLNQLLLISCRRIIITVLAVEVRNVRLRLRVMRWTKRYVFAVPYGNFWTKNFLN